MIDRIERIRQSFITRKAEESDTHDSIERHDHGFLKKKERGKDSDDHDWSDHEEDLADISVESLIIFLKGLLRVDEVKSPQNKDEKNIAPEMRQAMKAYGTVPEDKPKARYTYLDDEEQDYDTDQVKRLITILQSMLDNNIDHITLDESDGFLNSIEKTVEKYSNLA